MERIHFRLWCSIGILAAVLSLSGCEPKEDTNVDQELLGLDGEELEGESFRGNGEEFREEDLKEKNLEREDEEKEEKKDYIKWVDFQVTYEALDAAYKYDVSSYGLEPHYHWIELLAYLGAKYGGDFKQFQASDMKALCDRIAAGETMEELTEKMSYYNYYKEAYEAVLGGMVGEYQIEDFEKETTQELEELEESEESQDKSEVNYVTRYGLKAFSPIAKNFPYSDYDDFGASRSYGYRRVHLGHDMMGATGTPIIAVESGYVEALGWNQYGGWRIGIRSFDKKRYYYYAHLRKDFPYNKELKEGSVVQAGDVIGYLGHTGYSTKENVNNIDIPHLHFGLQLIFDESQKEGNNEIWIDCYALVRFLYRNRSETVKVSETKEWIRTTQFIDPAAEEYKKEHKE